MSPKKINIAYYITPHGFGHAVRSLEIIKELISNDHGAEVLLVSNIPEFLVEQNVGKALPYRRRRLDIGLVQRDSLQFDLQASLEALEKLRSDRDALIAEEVHFLKEERADLVVCDIPFLPFFAAAKIGIPSAGVSNFTWDWIYSAYAATDERWGSIISWIREGYAKCGLFLQLPMHGDCSACPSIRDVPLVARHATRKPEEVRQILKCPPESKLYLISFADLDLDEEAQASVERIKDAVFLYKHPLRYNLSNGISLDDLDLSYADVVAAVDAVITKPGYGIVSDCLAHGVPMIYTDRGHFPEYAFLVAEIERSLTSVYIKSEEIYSGAWEEAIGKIGALPRRAPDIRTDGAKVCAQLLNERADAERS